MPQRKPENPNPRGLKKGDLVQYVGPSRLSNEPVPHPTEYTLISEVDSLGYFACTWFTRDGDHRVARMNASDGEYQKLRPKTMEAHLYRNPGHTIEVCNTGMPAEFILAQCNECNWEAQW